MPKESKIDWEKGELGTYLRYSFPLFRPDYYMRNPRAGHYAYIEPVPSSARAEAEKGETTYPTNYMLRRGRYKNRVYCTRLPGGGANYWFKTKGKKYLCSIFHDTLKDEYQ